MNLVTLDHVTHQYSERVLLDDVSLLINDGERVGLIGVNGSGKTTLLRLVAGLETPDRGSVAVRGGARIQYLPQEPQLDDALTVLDQLFRSDSPTMRLLRDYEEASEALRLTPDDGALRERLLALSAELDRTGGWAAETEAKTILTRLGIHDFTRPVATLSGGERKRVALARALLDRADLLILDEPTNHIDAETIAWLEAYLAAFPGALLLVTHDRYFLDRVVTRIVELDRRQLVNYPGNYTRYLELRTERHDRLAQAEARRANLLRRELEWLRRSAAARTTKQKARKQRAEELLQIRADSGEERVTLALAGRRLGKKVLRARGLSKAYGDLCLFHDVDFDLAPGDRVGIIGPNGAGKSTFLDILAGKLAPDAGSVEWGETVHLGYYDQRSADLDDRQRVIDYIEEIAPIIHTADGERVDAARMLEWLLFPRPQQRAWISSLSGGERRRLYLLRTLILRPNVLFLDEPTNDLDLNTLEVLEEFLDHFRGALVVVSHDRYFLDRTVDSLVAFEDGRISSRYPAPFAVYQRLRAQEMAEQAPPASDRRADGAPTPRRQDPAPTRAGEGSKRALRKLTWKEQRELEELEPRIEALEAQQKRLQAEINASGGDYARLAALAEQLRAVEAELDAAAERWLELSEAATSPSA